MSYILQNTRGKIVSGLAFLILISCSQPKSRVNFTELEKQVNKGEFEITRQVIDSLKQQKKITPTEFRKLDSLQDVMYRISLDFSLKEKQIKEQLDNYFGELDDSLLQRWEQTGKLEMRRIDGKKRYFSNAAPNLFRLDSSAAVQKLKVDGKHVNSLDLFCLDHTTKVIRKSKNSFDPVLPVNMVLTYTIRVKPNVVPAGDMIRCWMPVPREGNPRQRKFKLLSSEPDSVIIAPNDYLQRTAFLTKPAIANEPTVFQLQFSIETSAQYFNLKPENVKSYDTSSEFYRHHTAERPPHLVFTPDITNLAKRIVGSETNPLRKVEKIYTWINDSIPWASALEYSIMPNIPEYVLACRHGDCGMHTLLFMSLARSQGIPVKWQSGFMLHPVHVNLHDWCEVYYEGIGWVPLDQSFKLQDSPDKQLREFYVHGIDSYRLIVNDDYGQELYPPKKYLRSEPYDFQRGEVEWDGGNLYFDQWNWHMEVDYQEEKSKIKK